METYPWHAQPLSLLRTQWQQGRPPHALILSGAPGLGKHHFAEALAQRLLCSGTDALFEACGQCRSCQLLQAGTHPDFHSVEPEEPGKQIRIDQIRALGEYLALASHYGGARIVLIDPAEQMNTAAANSLLKLLEEPPAGTLLILVATRPSRLPATIRSRCQKLQFSAPDQETGAAWLKTHLASPDVDHSLLLALGHQAPLAALSLAQGQGLQQRDQWAEDLLAVAAGHRDPVKVAADWLKIDPAGSINWLYDWVADLILLKATPSTASLANQNQQQTMQDLAEQVDLKRLFGLFDRVQEAIQLSHSQVNVQMTLEILLIYWTRLTRGKSA